MLKLRELREARGMTQSQLAEQSGVSQQAISFIESGKRPNPGIETLYSLARALGCTIEDLYSSPESEVSPT